MTPTYFSTPAHFRRWLKAHHGSATELLVGFHKVGCGTPSLTWPESVDEALCYGWIDGVRRRVDEVRYTIRFTPRRPNSAWSAVNIAKVQALVGRGRMQPAGLAAYEARRVRPGGHYSYEQRPRSLPRPYAGVLRADREAARFFAAQAASYRRPAIWWVVSAKQEVTRTRRLATLVERSARGELIPQFIRRPAREA